MFENASNTTSDLVHFFSVFIHNPAYTHRYSDDIAVTVMFGHVTLYQDGRHNDVLIDGWTDVEATVVCKEAGFNAGMSDVLNS